MVVIVLGELLLFFIVNVISRVVFLNSCYPALVFFGLGFETLIYIIILLLECRTTDDSVHSIAYL